VIFLLQCPNADPADLRIGEWRFVERPFGRRAIAFRNPLDDLVELPVASPGADPAPDEWAVVVEHPARLTLSPLVWVHPGAGAPHEWYGAISDGKLVTL
jgi:hypothetical protein